MEHTNTRTHAKLPNSFSKWEELVDLLAEGRKATEEGRGRPAKEVTDDIRRDIRNGTL